MSEQSSPEWMPWKQGASGGATPSADLADAATEEHGDAIAERLAAHAGVDSSSARAVVEAAASGDDRREAMQELGVHMTNEYAEKVGIDIERADLAKQAEALSTVEGRREAMQELGVHMSGALAERFGVEDPEAKRLMDASRALRTPEGRAQLMAEYAEGPADELVGRLAGRGLSIEERREAVSRLLAGDAAKRGLKKAGRGVLVAGIVAILVLLGVLIGAVAILGSITSGGADAVSAASPTRPDVASFVAWSGSA
ncbi:hypothetical protein [Microbacterium suaedae]|uniref:hypothetical protein n=1 Tax=Microbacterium suaedae TaxID=2067813 RepID=UPI000DA1E97B|nr:hypothetical protein [Microbacterium suaedae]